MRVAEKMHDVFGPGQQRRVPLNDDAVETAIYEDKDAREQLRKSFHRSPPRDFAPWRETNESPTNENALARENDAAFRIHTTLGPGLLESVYGISLARSN